MTILCIHHLITCYSILSLEQCKKDIGPDLCIDKDYPDTIMAHDRWSDYNLSCFVQLENTCKG